MGSDENTIHILYLIYICISRVTLYTAGHLHTAVPHCSHSRGPIVHTAVPRENNEHGCVHLRCRAVCKLPGCVDGHPWYIYIQKIIYNEWPWLITLQSQWIYMEIYRWWWVGRHRSRGPSTKGDCHCIWQCEPKNGSSVSKNLTKLCKQLFQWTGLMSQDSWFGVS